MSFRKKNFLGSTEGDQSWLRSQPRVAAEQQVAEHPEATAGASVLSEPRSSSK